MCSLITNIQKYSIHDGPGIRTTVFFKGCPLHCLWCHNPETQSFENEIWDDGEGVAREVDIDGLMEEILKDRIFYDESGGGVTLSGGEVLAQDGEFLLELLRRLKSEAIPVFIDTCGVVPYERIKPLLAYIRAFLYDLKLMDSEEHRRYTGSGNGLILDNLKRLWEDGAAIYVRVPMIKGLSAEKSNIDRMAEFLKDNGIKPEGINLLPYHDTGSGKYQRLGKTYEGESFEAPGSDEMEEYVKQLVSTGFKNVRIGG